MLRLAAHGLCFVTLLDALSGCVAAPDDASALGAGKPLNQRSSLGLVDATVTLEGGSLERGPHSFEVTLQAADGDASPQLVSVDASMAAHGHRVSASVAPEGERYLIEDLNLFMSGRWQVTLGVELDTRSDVVEFALDVP